MEYFLGKIENKTNCKLLFPRNMKHVIRTPEKGLLKIEYYLSNIQLKDPLVNLCMNNSAVHGSPKLLCMKQVNL